MRRRANNTERRLYEKKSSVESEIDPMVCDQGLRGVEAIKKHGKESNCIQVDPWNNHRSGTVVTKTGGESLQFCEHIRITGVIQSTCIE